MVIVSLLNFSLIRISIIKKFNKKYCTAVIYCISGLQSLRLLPSRISELGFDFIREKFIDTLMHFWPILGQRKSSLVVFFYKKGERVQSSFWPQYYFQWPDIGH